MREQDSDTPTSVYIEHEVTKLRQRHFVHEVGLSRQGQTIKIVRDRDGNIVGHQPFDATTYSEMKYGNPDAIHQAAEEIFQLITSTPSLHSVFQTQEVAFTNEAREVTTASFTIMGVLVNDYLNPYLEHIGANPVIMVRSERAGIISASDYGGLTKEERQKRIKERGAYFRPDNEAKMVGKKVVLFDDLVITGSYEANQKDLLIKSGVAEADIMPLYWVQVEPTAGMDPTFEKRLNHTAVKSLDDLLRFAYHPDFAITERLLKYILPIVDESGMINPQKAAALKSFFEQLASGCGDSLKAKSGQETLLKLYYAATSSDGYATMDRFQPGFLVLDHYLRTLLIHPKDGDNNI